MIHVKLMDFIMKMWTHRIYKKSGICSRESREWGKYARRIRPGICPRL